jgi:hypothetical protein
MKASDATIGLIIGGITALAGLSVVDKKKE